MVRLNVHEAKTHLSRYLDQVEHGEIVVLCRHNRPVAEIRALPAARENARVFGTDRGKLTIRPDFFDPLDDETLVLFGGDAA